MYLLIYILVGLTCGFIDSTLGMGYGVSATSVLIAFGITPALASASIHTSEGFVDIVSAISHHKLGNVERHLFWRLVIPGIIGAILGAAFLSWISMAFAKKFVVIILFLLGLIIFFRFARSKILIKTKLPAKFIPLLGFIAAFVDVTGGGGWGPICTPTFILGGSEPRKAIGTVEASEPFISFAAVLTFGLMIGFESFLWSLVLPIMIGGFILTPIAAKISSKAPPRMLGILIGLTLMILNGRTLLELFF
jgi:uncharacterized membrane protein YfcA